jgi:CTP:phosphocholine cytidylyltransferase-like protein
MNAIILAAGMGTRLRPLTDDRPKSLVETAGESFFSRQLRLLAEIGVKDITVVTGYRAEAFSPWKGRPGLEFVHNEHYFDRNNLWSMYLVRDRLGGGLVLEGDVWIGEGVLPGSAPERSSWFVGYRENMRNEWAVRVDQEDRVRRIEVTSGSDWILSGISYWTEADGRFIAARVAEMAEDPSSFQLFWDEVPRAHLDALDVRARRIASADWAEIDTLEDRQALEAVFAFHH